MHVTRYAGSGSTYQANDGDGNYASLSENSHERPGANRMSKADRQIKKRPVPQLEPAVQLG